MARGRVDSSLLARSRTYSISMSIYLRQDEIKPGALVRALSRDNEIVPALIMSFVKRTGFVRVLLPNGQAIQMNTAYLEHWK